MAVLVFLTATAWARIVTSYCFSARIGSRLTASRVSCCAAACWFGSFRSCFCTKIFTHILTTFGAASRTSTRCGCSGLLYRNLSAHQNRDCLIIDLVYHCGQTGWQTPVCRSTTDLSVHIAGVLYRMFQFIQFAQVLFPRLIDNVEQDWFFERFHHLFRFAFIGRFQVAGDVASVCRLW